MPQHRHAGFRPLLLNLLFFRYRHGFCHSCQQPSEWADEADRYRCLHCGQDPLEKATEESV